jgi:hypothetical protein
VVTGEEDLEASLGGAMIDVVEMNVTMGVPSIVLAVQRVFTVTRGF